MYSSSSLDIKLLTTLVQMLKISYMVVNSNQRLELQQYLKLLFNKSFKLGCISDILKIGSLFPAVCKNKDNARYAKNYRGILVTIYTPK